MQKFKLSDHIHYDRNDPDQPQSIYFDVDADFYSRLNAVVEAVEETLNKDKISDITIALARFSQAIETAFGALTLGELLYVSHYVSSMLTANTAEHVGFQKGVKHVTDLINRQNRQALTFNGKSSGIA